MIWHFESGIVGLAFNIEALRRGCLGGTSLALFIIKEEGLDWLGRRHLDMLGQYLDLETTFIDEVMDSPVWYLFWPFMDYHDAVVTYHEVLTNLVEKQDPANCLFYWGIYEGG